MNGEFSERGQYYQPEGSRRTIDQEIEQIKLELPELSDVLFPQGKTIIGMVREDFQSSTFRAAGYSYMPERYGRADRSLMVITFGDGSANYIVSGRISSGTPYEVMHAVMGGMDLRGIETVIYSFDGNETITERNTSGESNDYVGELGNPEFLLYHIRRSLGELVDTVSY